MSKNVIFIYSGISGLFCQCGNAEVIVMNNPLYHRYRHFSTGRDTSGGPGQMLAACQKCDSNMHNPEVRPQPADLRERLQAAYPGVDVDDLLAQCRYDQAPGTATPA
ncbi:hypothetical protein ACFPOU_08380 [Massilia jejuensis]|uniref:HNH endonuclease n=1 Tax=Massilia jejuensis TaxID=648894 RepID=A0ABW0PFN3_9BURK